jgi:Protein of unknown function (DUF2946)
MDDIVRQAMAKWPDVPDCYGWLGLDSRGQWWMRDDKAQALGGFQSGLPGAKGSVLRHEKLIDFIHRNYEADAQGCWYFQNGPQRVYIELEATPHIWHIGDDFAVTSHTGALAQVNKTLVDNDGKVYLHTPLGLGLVHTLDVHRVAQALEMSLWTLEDVVANDLPDQYGYVMSPEMKAIARKRA